jgi:hypothetical protein
MSKRRTRAAIRRFASTKQAAALAGWPEVAAPKRLPGGERASLQGEGETK